MADALIVYAADTLAKTAVPHLEGGNCNGRHHTSICRKTEKNKPFKEGSSNHSNNSHEMISHGNSQKPRGLNPELEPFHLPEELTAAL